MVSGTNYSVLNCSRRAELLWNGNISGKLLFIFGESISSGTFLEIRFDLITKNPSAGTHEQCERGTWASTHEHASYARARGLEREKIMV